MADFGPFFDAGDTVTHRKGGTYEVIEGPATCRIEAENVPAYAYRGEDGKLWVRPQLEFEDGRFALLERAWRPAPDRSPDSRYFTRIVGNIHDEGWNEHDLPTLTGGELRFLARCLGCPLSGSRSQLSVRILAVRQVRLKLAGFKEPERLADHFSREDLHSMAREAGTLRNGPKVTIANRLLTWRNLARTRARRFTSADLTTGAWSVRSRSDAVALARSL